MRKHPWLLIRLGSLILSVMAGIYLSTEFSEAKKLDTAFSILTGVFCFFAFKFADWIYQRRSGLSRTMEISKPSWVLPISGTVQTIDFVGWYTIFMGLSSTIYLVINEKSDLGGSAFFISFGVVILVLNWIVYVVKPNQDR